MYMQKNQNLTFNKSNHNRVHPTEFETSIDNYDPDNIHTTIEAQIIDIETIARIQSWSEQAT